MGCNSYKLHIPFTGLAGGKDENGKECDVTPEEIDQGNTVWAYFPEDDLSTSCLCTFDPESDDLSPDTIRSLMMLGVATAMARGTMRFVRHANARYLVMPSGLPSGFMKKLDALYPPEHREHDS